MDWKRALQDQFRGSRDAMLGITWKINVGITPGIMVLVLVLVLVLVQS